MKSTCLPLALSLLAALTALGATPGTDQPAQAPVISDSTTLLGDFANGSASNLDPPKDFDTAGQTLWWKFQATRPGWVRVTVTADGGRTPSLTTFRQEGDGSLTALGNNRVSGLCMVLGPDALDGVIAFEATPGETIALRKASSRGCMDATLLQPPATPLGRRDRADSGRRLHSELDPRLPEKGDHQTSRSPAGEPVGNC